MLLKKALGKMFAASYPVYTNSNQDILSLFYFIQKQRNYNYFEQTLFPKCQMSHSKQK